MNLRLLFVASITLLMTTGCNPNGTCVDTRELADLGASCVINTSKLACAEIPSTEFFGEESAAGVFRCKSLGYSDPPGAARATDPKALHIFYKKAAVAQPKK